MEYVFGVDRQNNRLFENLKTIATKHTSFSGYVETRRVYSDRIICDHFRVIRKYNSAENDEYKYDWYEITDHYRYTELPQDTHETIKTATLMSRITFTALSEQGNLDTTTMLEHADLYEMWAPGQTVKPGNIRSEWVDGELKLFRVNDGHGHTTQADWPPHSTPAMWTIIDLEHTGTQDDPIPAARGMEYTYGLYYKDPEDTKLYLCERIGEQSGNKITLQYLPHELVGNYFTLVG